MSADRPPSEDAPLTAEELDRLEALARAATRGPWEVRAPTSVYGNLQNDQNGTGDLVARTVEASTASAIAALDPPTALRLLAAARSNPTPAEGAGLWKAREAFLALIADGDLSTEVDGDETGVVCEHRIITRDGQLRDLIDALGIPGRITDSTEERIIAAVEAPALATPQPPQDTARLREALFLSERVLRNTAVLLRRDLGPADRIRLSITLAALDKVGTEARAALSATPEAQEPKS